MADVVEVLTEIRDVVHDFEFPPREYPRLLEKYGVKEAGQLYPALRKRLKELVDSL